MATVSDTELASALRAGKYENVYYFYGKDVMTIGSYAKRLSEKLVSPDAATYNLHKYDGRHLDLSELADTVDALPMFSDRVCILINDFNAEDYSSDDNNFLIGLINDIPETTVIVFYATGTDVCSGKKTPTAKNKKLIDAVSKKGAVCDFAYKTPAQLSKSIISTAEKQGCIISKDDAEYIAALCLSDTMLISGEVAKLISFTGSGTITREAIDSLVSKQLDSSAFDLSKAVVRLDGRTALSLLDELFMQRADAISVLSAIIMAFNDLYRAKLALTEGVSASDVVSDFGYRANRKFAVDNAFRDVRKISAEHLRSCMSILAKTDIALKSSSNDGRLMIEKAIVEMVSKR